MTRRLHRHPHAALAALAAREPEAAAEGDALTAPPPSPTWGLRWPGKAAALRLADAPPHAEVVPVPADSCDFAHTAHLFYEGDNLDALKLLLPTYRGQVRAIYIDPPYNTGNAFIFADDLRRPRGRSAHHAPGGRADAMVSDGGDDERAPSEWTDGWRPWVGAHAAWLSMLYPRLVLARELLRDDGALCLSIGEEEVHHARMLLDEVFGEEQHRNTLVVRRQDKNLSRQFMAHGLPSLAVGFEYVLIYARSPAFLMRPVFRPSGARRATHGYWKGFWNAADRPTMRYPLLGVTPAAGQWKWRKAVAREAVANYARYEEARQIEPTLTLEDYWRRGGRGLRFIRRNAHGRGHNQGVEHWIPPSDGILRTSNWTDQLIGESLHELGLPFDHPKRVAVLKDLLRLCAADEGVILDFFAGSGSIGQAVWELNLEDGGQRRFILVQRPEPTRDPRFPTIADITKERLRRVAARLATAHAEHLARGDAAAPDLGFRVHKLVPHAAVAHDATIATIATKGGKRMATDKATAERLTAYLEAAGPIRIRAMMGGYLVYLDDVYVAQVNEGALFIKPTAAGDALAGEVERASPYDGAKPAYKLSQADLERTDWLVALLRATREALKGK